VQKIRYGLPSLFSDECVGIPTTLVFRLFLSRSWSDSRTFWLLLAVMITKLSLMSPAWDTDSKQGFIQAPTGLRDEEEKEGKAKQADICP
jgi:hypothetical protein